LKGRRGAISCKLAAYHIYPRARRQAAPFFMPANKGKQNK